jgi:superfamily II DNA helicase RecQ
MEVAAVAFETFGIVSLKPEQVQTIQALCDGKIVVSVLPTGYGKSLCYQVAMMLEGFEIVVSPLLALCSDQMEYLTQKGVKLRRYDSTMEHDDKEEALIELVQPHTQMKAIFTTPESLQRSTPLINALKKAHASGSVSFVVVDEAHCVESWSSFRYGLRKSLIVPTSGRKEEHIRGSARSSTNTSQEKVQAIV